MGERLPNDIDAVWRGPLAAAAVVRGVTVCDVWRGERGGGRRLHAEEERASRRNGAKMGRREKGQKEG